MNGRKGLFVFGAGVLGTLCLVASAGAGCQSSGSGTGGNGTSNGGNGTQGTATNSGPGGNGGNGSMSTSTISGSNTGGSTSASTGTMQTCTSDMDATIDQVAKGADNGGLGTGIKVKISGAVAMSHKFLVSQSKSTGSCLWGVFLSMPGISTTAEFSGVLAVSYGTDAVTNEAGSAFCPVPPLDPAGDSFPDDVAPGDVLDVIGKTDAYAPSACGTMGNPAASPQVQLSQVCQATKNGAPVTPPAPATLTLQDATKLAMGDKATSEKWAGVKVQLGAQTATPVNACTCTTPPPNCMTSLTDCFGNITLAGSGLEITDKIYYQGLLSKSFMKTCHAGPDYTTPAQAFTNVQGFISLDFCTWEIYPNDKCTDLSPGGADCPCTDCMGGPGKCN